MAANGKAADDGRVTDLATTTNTRLAEARSFGMAGKWWSGWYYSPPAGAFGAYSTNPSQKQQQWVPLWVPQATAIDRIGLEITTAAPSARTVTLLIYANDPLTNGPGVLWFNAGTIDPTGTAGVREITISKTLTRGLWWLSFHTTDQIYYRGRVGLDPTIGARSGSAYSSSPRNSLTNYAEDITDPAKPLSTLKTGNYIGSVHMFVRAA